MKDLRISIVDTERHERGELDGHFIIDIDNLTARSFYEGLPLEYRLQLSSITHPRYTDMFAGAKAIAKRQELDRQRSETRPRHDRERETRPLNPIGKPLAHSTPQRPNYTERYAYSREASGRRDYNYDTRNREPPRNNLCEYYPLRRDAPPVNRHTKRYDQSRDTARNEFNRNNDRPSNNRADQSICKYCKNFGHTIDECRKRQYNNSQRDGTGKLPGPSEHRNLNPTDEKRNTRSVNMIEAEEKGTDQNLEPESQS